MPHRVVALRFPTHHDVTGELSAHEVWMCQLGRPRSGDQDAQEEHHDDEDEDRKLWGPPHMHAWAALRCCCMRSGMDDGALRDHSFQGIGPSVRGWVQLAFTGVASAPTAAEIIPRSGSSSLKHTNQGTLLAHIHRSWM